MDNNEIWGKVNKSNILFRNKLNKISILITLRKGLVN